MVGEHDTEADAVEVADRLYETGAFRVVRVVTASGLVLAECAA